MQSCTVNIGKVFVFYARNMPQLAKIMQAYCLTNAVPAFETTSGSAKCKYISRSLRGQSGNCYVNVGGSIIKLIHDLVLTINTSHLVEIRYFQVFVLGQIHMI